MKTLSWNDIPPIDRADSNMHLTEDQREERIRTALHEAGHIVVGHRFGAPCIGAVVRVPGKSPKTSFSMRGTVGHTTVIANDPRVNAMVCLAGMLVELIFVFDDIENGYEKAARRARLDLVELHEETNSYSREDEEALVLDTLKILADNWGAIDGAASYLLAHHNAGGDIPRKKLIELSELLDKDGWQWRRPYIALPWQYLRPPIPLVRAEINALLI